MVKLGSRFGGFRTLSTRTCHDLVAELVEADSEGKSTTLTTYDVSGIDEACKVS